MLDRLMLKMAEFDAGSPQRIQHFTKVHAYCAVIGRSEALDEKQRLILEAAAYTHDIGIRPALEKYGGSAGHLQEREGPAYAKAMLDELGFADDVVQRVCWLIAHHHTYAPVDGIDHRILIEADFLVNLFENNSSPEVCRAVYESHFETAAGKRLWKAMFGREEG